MSEKKLLQVKFAWEDRGFCREYYRTIPNKRLFCRQMDNGKDWTWYTVSGSHGFNEPDTPIDMDLNEVEIIQ